MNIHQLIRLFISTALLLWSMNSFAQGSYTGPNRDTNGNIVPTPKGEKCVEPTADMRANHMSYLLHKRDETMHIGIRTKKHSLTECINCHATPDSSGTIARVSSDQHFCSSCHRSASVKLDCFECHADRPVESFSTSKSSPQKSAVEGVNKFLQAMASNKPQVASGNRLQ